MLAQSLIALAASQNFEPSGYRKKCKVNKTQWHSPDHEAAHEVAQEADQEAADAAAAIAEVVGAEGEALVEEAHRAEEVVGEVAGGVGGEPREVDREGGEGWCLIVKDWRTRRRSELSRLAH